MNPPCGAPHYHRDPSAGELSCEGRRLSELAAEHGTPLYVYSRAAMVERFERLQGAFGSDATVAFAVKSNPNLHLLRLFDGLGAGFDVVSLGELRRLQAAGVAAIHKTVFAGVAKQDPEIEAALEAGILFFNLESEHEIEAMERAGEALGTEVPLAVRLNPDVDPRTHAYISTGKKENKFGLDLATAGRLVEGIARSDRLRLCGYHVHLGSQLRAVDPYLEAFDRVAAFVDQADVRAAGVTHYDLGGGFGTADAATPEGFDVAALGGALVPRIAARGWRPVLEPGRFLVADAGVLLTRVIGHKRGADREFLLVDAAMNDLVRPALYGAEHPIEPVRAPDSDAAPSVLDVVGPVCETADFLARGRAMVRPRRGDLLAVCGAGAYGATMASNYNSRRRAAEVLVDGDRARVIRRRERYEDLWAQELDP